LEFVALIVHDQQSIYVGIELNYENVTNHHQYQYEHQNQYIDQMKPNWQVTNEKFHVHVEESTQQQTKIQTTDINIEIKKRQSTIDNRESIAK
jgi:hypothetical protein